MKKIDLDTVLWALWWALMIAATLYFGGHLLHTDWTPVVP